MSKRARSEPHDVDPLQPRPEMLPQGDDELTEAVEMYMQNTGPLSEPTIILVNEFRICTTLELKTST